MTRNSFLQKSLVLVLLGLGGCKKANDFLDLKTRLSDVTPRTLEELQQTLNNHAQINLVFPIVGLAGSDNFSVPDEQLTGISQVERNCYTWAADIYAHGSS